MNASAAETKLRGMCKKTYIIRMARAIETAKAAGCETEDAFIAAVEAIMDTPSFGGIVPEWRETSKPATQSDAIKQARDERNALLTANGYTWREAQIRTSPDPDDWTVTIDRYLVNERGERVTETQALDEIARGREVVRAEIQAAKDAKAKLEAEAEAREIAFDRKVAEIKYHTRVNATECEGIEWETIIALAGNSVSKGAKNGVVYYNVHTGVNFDDFNGWHAFYRHTENNGWW